jgi:hypothetical protein
MLHPEYDVVFFREGVQEMAVVERDAWAGNFQVRFLSTSVSTHIHTRDERRRRAHGTTRSPLPVFAHKPPNGHRHLRISGAGTTCAHAHLASTMLMVSNIGAMVGRTSIHFNAQWVASRLIRCRPQPFLGT